MPTSWTLIKDERNIVRRETYTNVYEVWHGTGDGTPTQKLVDLATHRPIGQLYADLPDDNARVVGHVLLRTISPTVVRVGVIYQTPRVGGGGTTRAFRTQQDVKEYEFNYMFHTRLPDNTVAHQTAPDTINVSRYGTYEYRRFPYGAYSEQNIAAVESALAENINRQFYFPIAGYGTTPIPRVLIGATMTSDQDNQLYATYVFYTRFPVEARTYDLGPDGPPFVLPQLASLDEYAAPVAGPEQWLVGVTPAADLYGTLLNATILPGVQV